MAVDCASVGGISVGGKVGIGVGLAATRVGVTATRVGVTGTRVGVTGTRVGVAEDAGVSEGAGEAATGWVTARATTVGVARGSLVGGSEAVIVGGRLGVAVIVTTGAPGLSAGATGPLRTVNPTGATSLRPPSSPMATATRRCSPMGKPWARAISQLPSGSTTRVPTSRSLS